MTMGLLWQLFSTFFFIGLLNFGGGGAMISLIQGQVVALHGWLTEGAFTDIVAISQSTPGPMAINCATYVGYEVMKTSGYGQLLAVFGSAVSTLAVVLPSFLVFFVVIRLFNKYHNSPVKDVFILSAGHLAPVFYATLARAGYFPVHELGTLRKFGSRLQGHPCTTDHLPGIYKPSGSLGQGLSVAAGIALGKKLDGDP